ncbi:MAG: carbohydrate ABC transporter permease [Chloroflexota bacterium]
MQVGAAKKLTPYLYLMPALALILLVFVYPVIDLIWRSFNRVVQGVPTWTGFVAYQNALRDPIFWTSFWNNIRLFLSVPILVVLSLIFSTLIFERIRGWRIYRSIVFIPYVLAIPVVGIVFSYILQANGVFNTLLRSIGLDAWAREWLGSPSTAIWAIMFVIIWKELGFGIVLFLARLSSISEELFDSAKLDGANWWQQLFYITVPQMTTVIEFYIIVNMITMLSWVFAYILVMTKGGPGNSTWVLEYFIYQKAFPYSQMQIASAAAVLLLLFASALMFIQARLRRQVEGYGG